MVAVEDSPVPNAPAASATSVAVPLKYDFPYLLELVRLQISLVLTVKFLFLLAFFGLFLLHGVPLRLCVLNSSQCCRTLIFLIIFTEFCVVFMLKLRCLVVVSPLYAPQ